MYSREKQDVQSSNPLCKVSSVGEANIFLAIVFISIIAGCSQNSEDLVKNGTLQFDQSVTVGDAFNGYIFFGTKTWSSFTDSQNRQIVQFDAAFDFDKFAGSECEDMQLTAEMVEIAKKKLRDTKLAYIAQFYVDNNGKAFNLRYSGMRCTGTDKNTGEKFEEEIKDDQFLKLKPIFTNKPEPTTWLLLYSNGN